LDVKAFERIALPSLDAGEGSVLLIDEIGKMECCSEEFMERVARAFESETPILATIPLRGGGAFIEGIRRRQDVETVLVAPENRDELPEQLAAKINPGPLKRHQR
jgi:nucleoside-triphosphatase